MTTTARLDILLTGMCMFREVHMRSPRSIIIPSPLPTTLPSAPSGLSASAVGRTEHAELERGQRYANLGQPRPELQPACRPAQRLVECRSSLRWRTPTIGYRRVPQLGNANHGLTATLKNLAFSTTYYWEACRRLTRPGPARLLPSEGELYTARTPPDSVTSQWPRLLE